MHSNHFSISGRRLLLLAGIAIFLIPALYAADLPMVQAQGLPPIDPTPVEPKTPPPGMESLATDLSAAATADPYEVDDTVPDLEAGLIAGNDQLLTSAVPQTHSISPVGDKDWVKFVLTTPSSITLETTGPNLLDDTEMWLYNSSQQQLDYNDDKNPNNWHSYIQRCGPTALPAGTYYAMIDKRLNDAEIASYNITLTINPAGPANCLPNTTVIVAGQNQGSYWVHPETTARQSYTSSVAGAGPARVLTNDKVKPLIASTGISLKKNTGYESYTEFIGVPNSRLTDTYYFPWYNNVAADGVGLVTQLCFGNVGKASTIVTVTIGKLSPSAYGLGINKGKCVSYAGVNNGPVKVKSSGLVPIVASLSTRMKSNPTYTSYAEFGGLSASDTLSTDYMFPVYNNLGASVSRLRYTNIGTSNTNVTVLVQGVPKWSTFGLAPNVSKYITIPNLNAGPVHVQSSNSVPISVSMIAELKTTSTYTSYTELMGLPAASMTDTRFVFPWYSNASSGNLVSQLRIRNVGIAATNVSVTIGGITVSTVSLLPGANKVVSFSNVNNGPVVLQSSSNVPILASMMIYLKGKLGYTSYSEYIGQLALPKNQLKPTVWFPWYYFAGGGSFFSELHFSLPTKP